MTWEWKIGDPVDDSNGGTMDAMNWGHTSDDDDKKQDFNSYNDNNGYGSYRPYRSRQQINRNRLESLRDRYKFKLKEARNQTYDERRIEYYFEALKIAREYFKESEKLGMTVEGMPVRGHLLSHADVEWISKKHYDEFYKIHILSTDQTENLERLLKESGNGERIKRNEEIRRAREEENARRMGISHSKYLNEEYFRHIEKANDLVLKNKPRHAVDEYQKAVTTYEQFFKSKYVQMGMVRKMPEKSLTPEAVDNILKIYVKTHPLIASGNVNAKINMQILDMLDGDWDDQVREADRKAYRILEEKRLERQKRKEKFEDIASDVIVGAQIVGNSILNRFKR